MRLMLRRLLVPPFALIVLGAIAAVAIPGKAGTAAAIALVGTACVVAVSMVFWEVGRSEDEERARR
jgi:ABC-type sugar transport system permease subunit